MTTPSTAPAARVPKAVQDALAKFLATRSVSDGGFAKVGAKDEEQLMALTEDRQDVGRPLRS